MHIYAHIQEASWVQDYVSDYMNDHMADVFIHIMEEGPLWHEAVNYFPDAEFYEAAHSAQVQTYETMHPEVQMQLDQFIGRLRELP